MEQFFAIKREIPTFLNKYVPSDTTGREVKFQHPNFLSQLDFLTDLANHLNSLNFKEKTRQFQI